MYRRTEQHENVRNRGAAAFAADPAKIGHRDADEHVPFGVLTWSGLEEPLKPGNPRLVGALPQPGGEVSAHTTHAVLTPTP